MLLSVPDPAVNYGVKEEATWEENTDVAQMSVGRLSWHVNKGTTVTDPLQTAHIKTKSFVLFGKHPHARC